MGVHVGFAMTSQTYFEVDLHQEAAAVVVLFNAKFFVKLNKLTTYIKNRNT